MELLLELLDIIEEAKGKGIKTLRQKVYHADYVKTKNKPYRKYARQKRRYRRENND